MQSFPTCSRGNISDERNLNSVNSLKKSFNYIRLHYTIISNGFVLCRRRGLDLRRGDLVLN